MQPKIKNIYHNSTLYQNNTIFKVRYVVNMGYVVLGFLAGFVLAFITLNIIKIRRTKNE